MMRSIKRCCFRKTTNHLKEDIYEMKNYYEFDRNIKIAKKDHIN